VAVPEDSERGGGRTLDVGTAEGTRPASSSAPLSWRGSARCHKTHGKTPETTEPVTPEECLHSNRRRRRRRRRRRGEALQNLPAQSPM